MSAKIPTTSATSKEGSRQGSEAKVPPANSVPTQTAKPLVPPLKIINKTVTVQPKEMSPGAQEEDRPELLGSLTTEQQQRTSARVIKKLRLEPQPAQKRSETVSDEVGECETPGKAEDKEAKVFPTVKQRMPKALWSIEEKNYFFEALNEYGKDFDAITAHIRAKMKKKAMPDANLKTKTQVSHFYYRTWHKLSKHVRFDENVKKVAQELYALINYGELRRKLVSVNEKTCGRLSEMVLDGSMVVRARGRNLRVRTPMCRALRRLNQITERLCGARVCSLASVAVRARDCSAWARVQAAAHNPRAQLLLPPRAPLARMLLALQARWTAHSRYKHKMADTDKEDDAHGRQPEESEHVENHLNLDLDRVIVEEQKAPKKLALHVGPRPDAEIHLPVASPAEPLSSHKICFSSYLERMGDQTNNVKIRTPKRQRKDSTTEKDKEVEQKKFKTEEMETKPINIEETAIDGIELMANYKNSIDSEKLGTEDEKEVKEEEPEEEVERDKDLSEREKDSFSEMEDDEKFNKSDTDNESDGKPGKDRKFKNLKVKFRIRPKKRGGSVYTVVTDEAKEDKPDIDVDMALRQIRRGWSARDAGDLTIGDLYLMFGSRSKLELDYWWAEPTPPLPLPLKPKLEDKDRKTDKDTAEDGGAKESDTDIFSPKTCDSNDGSGDERKAEQVASPEHKGSSTLKLTSKLINRPCAHPHPHPPAPAPAHAGFALLSERLKRLLAYAGNAHVNAIPRYAAPACAQRKKPASAAAPAPAPAPLVNNDDGLFRHPPPIAPKAEQKRQPAPLDMEEMPRGRRGRPRHADRRIVVQRLLPLLPKLPPPTTLVPVKIVPDSPPALPKILPKPPPTSTSDLSFFYVLSESNGQFYFHDGDRRIPISQLGANSAEDDEDLVPKSEVLEVDDDEEEECSASLSDSAAPAPAPAHVAADMTSFLPSESMSLSPSRLLRDSEWLAGSVQDFSLGSFLSHLDGRPAQHDAVESQLHSLMAESSVDYVAKFADLAAEVTAEPPPDPATLNTPEK